MDNPLDVGIFDPTKSDPTSIGFSTPDVLGGIPGMPNAPIKRKSSKKKLIVILVLVLFICSLLGTFLLLSFPLKVTCTANQKTEENARPTSDLVISIKSNQAAKSVYYSFSPKDSENLKEYTEAKLVDKGFEPSIKIPKEDIPDGANVLHIYYLSIFNKSKVCKINTLYSIVGFSSAPDPDAIVTTEDGFDIVSNELTIRFLDGTSDEDINDLIDSYGGTTVGAIYLTYSRQVKFDTHGENEILELKEQIEAEDIVDIVGMEQVYKTGISLIPNDPEFFGDWDESNPGGNNWWLECIEAPAAWDYNGQMSTTKIGVIDSSLDYSHEDLQIPAENASISPSDDFKTLDELEEYFDNYTGSNRSINSMMNHGSHCAGIIGAVSDNGVGISGTGWQPELYFRTLWSYYNESNGDVSWYSTTFSLQFGIAKLVMSGCRAVSMSFGEGDASSPGSSYEISETALLDDLVASLENAGYDFLFVKAAGNEAEEADDFFLNRVFKNGTHTSAHTIIVGAVAQARSSGSWDINTTYSMSSYSNYGSFVDITAPGDSIYSTVHGNSYASMDGTSMATPCVAGVISLVYSIDSNLTYDAVKNIICSSASYYCECGNDSTTYGIVNAKNAVEMASNWSGSLPTPADPTAGLVNGTVQDAVTTNLLDGVSITITNIETGAITTSSSNNGVYNCTLPSGTYDMKFEKSGYITETVYSVEITSGVTNYNVLLNLVTNGTTTGSASGMVIDAFDAHGISGATIKFYPGVNSTSGNPVATVVSDSSGYYSVTLDPGNYTARVTASGYAAGSATVTIVSDMNIVEQDCTLTPSLTSGETRIVLTWGESPRDLDSHLVGPTPDGGRFHTYFISQSFNYYDALYDQLDVDDTSSYGPETTTIYVPVDGTYTYFVHDYTNAYSGDSTAMSMSGATVTVYLPGSNSPYVFHVPSSQGGTLWTVFSITNGILTPINTMGYENTSGYVGDSTLIY